ncbi:hypothetical protein [Micromonospora gifhornensis]|uniref:hypothetical protein n=1 Tax=Micromonospora gifhornensis TaxID=84594 RepID=UPI0019542936|nr:hypothetical protein [Micromonospora gifhornensis]
MSSKPQVSSWVRLTICCCRSASSENSGGWVRMPRSITALAGLCPARAGHLWTTAHAVDSAPTSP